MQPSNWEIHQLLGLARISLYQHQRDRHDEELIDKLCNLEGRLRNEGLRPEPAACGKRVCENGESWLDWWIWSNDEIKPIADDCETDWDLLVELVGTAEGSPLSAYSPTGQPFYSAPVLRRGLHHTLVTMAGGLDV
jgi:hypothetical protein